MKPIAHDPVDFHISLKLLLKNDKGEMLLLKSISKNKEWHDTWDLPGGRINKDEIDVGFHEAIDREIKEEVGEIEYVLRADPVSLSKCSYEHDDSQRFFILFEAKYIKGEIKVSEEHSGYAWKKITSKNAEENFHQVIKQLMVNYFKWNK